MEQIMLTCCEVDIENSKVTVAKIGNVAISGKNRDDAIKRLTEYLQSSMGKDHFCEDHPELYDQTLFKLFDLSEI